LLVYESSREKTFKTDSTLAVFHHIVLQLPPHTSHMNATELTWAKINLEVTDLNANCIS